MLDAENPAVAKRLEEQRRKKKLAEKSITIDGGAEYNPAVKADLQAKLDQGQEGGGGADKVAPSASGSAGSAGKAMASSAAGGGSLMDTASAGMMASGNPYAMAGAMAIQVMSARRKRMDAQAQMEYKAEQNRKQRIVDQLALMSQQASNLGL